MNKDEKIKLLNEIMTEFKLSSNSMIHPHVDGFLSIVRDRIINGYNVDVSNTDE